jgi:predicted negative regulator of RcsB-dependent stress response
MGFGFHNVEHAFASVAKDIVKTASIFNVVASRVEKAAPEIEALTGAIYPPAVLIERAAFGLLGVAANAANTVGAASAAKGLNISLDEDSIKQLQEIAKLLESHVQAFSNTSLIESPAPAAHGA